jgi:hypothetical protein
VSGRRDHPEINCKLARDYLLFCYRAFKKNIDRGQKTTLFQQAV